MKIFIHAHVYYPEVWPELKTCLANLMEYPSETFVTLPAGKKALKSAIQNDIPSCHIIETENKGYDILPFLKAADAVDLAEFDCIAKIHTKRQISCILNNLLFIGPAWRRKLLEPFSNKTILKESLNILASNPSVGMIAHPAVISCHDNAEIESAADALVESTGHHACSHRFVAGTMFLARTKAITPIISKLQTLDNFSAYVAERALGYAVAASGYTITDTRHLLWLYESTYNIRGIVIDLLRFLYRISIKPLVKNTPLIQQISNAQPCVRTRQSTVGVSAQTRTK